jgi:type II secretory pathway component GspD/PulD (secretin)
VPVLSRLPGVGALFKSSQKKREKTELVLLITPRIIESPDEWGGVMNKIRSSLDYLSVKPANVAP